MADKDIYVTNIGKKNLHIEKIGGKGLNLNKMSTAGFNIPHALVILTDAYDIFIDKLKDEISKKLNEIDFKDDTSIKKGCESIRRMIKSQRLSDTLSSEINPRIRDLPDVYYAVRSSAVAEDLLDASFAGQLDSFLNVKKEDIVDKIIHCWASYWNDHAVKYRHDTSTNKETGMGNSPKDG